MRVEGLANVEILSGLSELDLKSMTAHKFSSWLESSHQSMGHFGQEPSSCPSSTVQRPPGRAAIQFPWLGLLGTLAR